MLPKNDDDDDYVDVVDEIGVWTLPGRCPCVVVDIIHSTIGIYAAFPTAEHDSHQKLRTRTCAINNRLQPKANYSYYYQISYHMTTT